MSVPLTLLGLLEREPSHGYDLKRDYDLYFGRDKPLPFGQVYATLSRLARDGKVISGEAEPGAGPDRKRARDNHTGATPPTPYVRRTPAGEMPQLDPRQLAAMRVLGVEPGADATAIKRAYRHLARSFHPDLHPTATDEERRELADRFVAVTAAYQALVA